MISCLRITAHSTPCHDSVDSRCHIAAFPLASMTTHGFDSFAYCSTIGRDSGLFRRLPERSASVMPPQIPSSPSPACKHWGITGQVAQIALAFASRIFRSAGFSSSLLKKSDVLSPRQEASCIQRIQTSVNHPTMQSVIRSTRCQASRATRLSVRVALDAPTPIHRHHPTHRLVL